MAEYKIIFDRDVEKDLARLPKKVVKNVLKKVMSLAHQPHPGQSLKLAGTTGLYRLRIGDYRAVYLIDDHMKNVTIYHVRHRKDVYRGF